MSAMSSKIARLAADIAQLRLPPSDIADLRYFWSEFEADIGVRSLHFAQFDAMMGFRAYRIAAFKTMNVDEDGLTFPTQGSIQFTKYGYKIAEVGANEPKRIGGVRKAHNIYTGLALLRMIAKELVRPVKRPRQ